MTKWHAKTIQSMLQNEKYKGDAILQKSYTVDFLTKKRAKNEGHIQQYQIKENHEAIIDPSFGKRYSWNTIEEVTTSRNMGPILTHTIQKETSLQER